MNIRLRLFNLKFLLDRLSEAPFIAAAPIGAVHPDLYTGPQRCSSVLRPGERIWLFRTEDDRALFLTNVQGARSLDKLEDVT